MIGIIISAVTTVGLTSCESRDECKTKKSEYDCKTWCLGGIFTEGYDFNKSSGEC